MGTHIFRRGSRGSNERETGQRYCIRRQETGPPPKLNKEVEDKSIAENQKLRMELDYLKKLSALVVTEERKNGKKL